MTATKARDLGELPEPDKFGNFWFGRKGCGDGPAVFKSRGGAYVAMRGEAGMVWDGARLKEFDTPGAALKALRRLADGRGK